MHGGSTSPGHPSARARSKAQSPAIEEPKAVIVHDYLLQRGGAERVVDALLAAFPTAELVTSIISGSYRRRYAGRKLTTTYLDRLPVTERTFRVLLPLFARAFSRLELPPVDVAVCSSSGWSHMIAPRARVPVVVYCHTPARWLWRADEYFLSPSAAALRIALAPLLSRLRVVDRASARAASHYVANSQTVAKRIARCYGIEASVVYPPVEVDRFRPGGEREDFYLVVSRLLDYKRIDLAIDACSRLGRRLVVAGTGPALSRLRRRAGSTIEFAGWQPEEDVERLMQTCRALLFPGEEDFGITAVEAMATGAPVVGFNGGGARETVVDGVTGVLFERQSVDHVVGAILDAESRSWESGTIRSHAESFGVERFIGQIRTIVREAVA
jgi:glycosyltransferase involved in cell wall biosynthesis